MPSSKPRLIVVLAALVAALVVGLVGLRVATDDRVRHHQGWQRADLDRNALDLALYRMRSAVSGPGMLSHDFAGTELARAVREGTVVSAGGTARLQRGGDLYVVVRYRLPTGGGGLQPATYRTECWRFTTEDGYDVKFGHVACP
jgi:hypothetical protein